MVAERRERKAAPSTWVQPEPAGKGKPVGSKKKSPAKKKQQQPVKSSVNATTAVTAPVNNVAPASAIETAVNLQDESIYGGQQQQQVYGQQGNDGDEMSLENGTASTTQLKGGAGPIETETGEQLFCICLGVDNGTPMIFCEACENW